ncbi:hypothetical protein [Nonomuraea angiospora]|uniref:hypothetical protein n=1 Tax=Nonomuraea angiospora TaxID=46172 RepID=UPI0029AE97BB|nr:hypothetical protein [Nonomuraea angiospora]MDX3100481.1 hypothetical protein [Nonomuraea angiospora]
MSDCKQEWEAALQKQGLAVLRDLLAQVDGLESSVMDLGGPSMIVIVHLADGGVLGIERGSDSTDLQSPDGWLVYHYAHEQHIPGYAALLRDNATFADLLGFFSEFAPGRPFPAFLFPDMED